jgi:DtxR family transcriptional regulator, Mn-dependent transcriptional regulator
VGHAPSAAEQDYLKQIYCLQEETGRATTQELATRLGVKPSSVTAMLKHLATDPAGPYVRHTPYRGVELTDKGRAVALEILRHHRLIELFLAQLLDMPWDQVHAEAERLEHVLSEELEERIAAKLGQPTHDPHGDPIPTREGVVPAREAIPLSALAPGAAGTVTRIAQQEQPVLQYLQGLGLVPGAHVTVTAVAPYGDVLMVRVGDASHAVGGTIARSVQVRPDGDGMPERELAAGEAGAGGEPASAYHPRDGEEAPLARRREESDQWAIATRTAGGSPAGIPTPLEAE